MRLQNMKKQRGVGLIEVLVAVLVLGIGLLGLAALQTQSLRYSHSAYLRSQATLLAYDIIDRMRANYSAAVNTTGYVVAINEAGSNSTACESSTCSTSQLAAYDVDQWLYNLSQELPKGDGTVAVSSGEVTVTVQWDEKQTTVSHTVEVVL